MLAKALGFQVLLLLLVALLPTARSSSYFVPTNDNRCALDATTANLKGTFPLKSTRNCALKCSSSTICVMFQVVPSNNTCQIYAKATKTYAQITVVRAAGLCFLYLNSTQKIVSGTVALSKTSFIKTFPLYSNKTVSSTNVLVFCNSTALTPVSWSDASGYCSEFGYYLAQLSSSTVYNSLFATLPTTGHCHAVHVGGTYSSDISNYTTTSSNVMVVGDYKILSNDYATWSALILYGRYGLDNVLPATTAYGFACTSK